MLGRVFVLEIWVLGRVLLWVIVKVMFEVIVVGFGDWFFLLLEVGEEGWWLWIGFVLDVFLWLLVGY